MAPSDTAAPDPHLAAALLRRLVSGGAIPADAWAELPEPQRQASPTAPTCRPWPRRC